MGINNAPSPGPILANPGMAENAAAFHCIRPHDIGVHDGQYRIDVARVEGVIRAAEKILSVHLGFYPCPTWFFKPANTIPQLLSQRASSDGSSRARSETL